MKYNNNDHKHGEVDHPTLISNSLEKNYMQGDLSTKQGADYLHRHEDKHNQQQNRWSNHAILKGRQAQRQCIIDCHNDIMTMLHNIKDNMNYLIEDHHKHQY